MPTGHGGMGFRDIVRGSVRELDRTLGERVSGMAISGMLTPGFRQRRTKEDPMHITERVLVEPMLNHLGYGRNPSDGRLAVVTATMNSDLPSLSERTIRTMSKERDLAGIGTDGFRWILMTPSDDGRFRVRAVFDLREYYLEELERVRFRSAVPRGDELAWEFTERMSRDAVLGGYGL